MCLVRYGSISNFNVHVTLPASYIPRAFPAEFQRESTGKKVEALHRSVELYYQYGLFQDEISDVLRTKKNCKKILILEATPDSNDAFDTFSVTYN